MADIYQFLDYKEYLRKRMAEGDRGILSRIARFAQCQPSYLSQVLTRKAHLNQDQAWLISEALGLNADERKYFLSLVELGRSHHASYRKYMSNQIEDLRRSRLILKEKFPAHDELGEAERSLYYSTYLYAAIQVLCSLPHCKTRDAMAAYLKVPMKRLSKVIEDLIRMGLVIEKRGQLEVGKQRMHLPADSSHIVQHHRNWRLRALASIEQNRSESLHYSSIVTLSRPDAEKLKNQIVDFLVRAKKLIQDSPSEKCYALNFDYFELSPD